MHVPHSNGQKVIGVIPARYSSTRFPGKPLALIAGKPMIQRVYENAVQAVRLSRVIVATDDERIAECVKDFGGECVLTDSSISTGTERVTAAIGGIDAEIVLNIQGDEPLVPPKLLDKLAEILINNKDTLVCTPVVRITSYDDLVDSNQVRVVFDKNLRALYFTRASVPFCRDIPEGQRWLEQHEFWKHIGIYCFRRDFLDIFVKLSLGKLELAERLEQLRILENGYPVHVVITDYHPVCVDIPQDIVKVEGILSSINKG